MVQGVQIVNGYLINCDPATGKEIGRVLCTSPEDLDNMLNASRNVQLDWQLNYDAKQRAELIKEGLRSLNCLKDEVASMITSEMGKIKSEAIDEVDGAVDKNEWIDAIVEANLSRVVGDDDGAQSEIIRDALGVVVVLAPWNFPADEILLLAIPALIAGNVVVVKPSEVAPSTGAMVVNAIASALPPFVFQVAQGDGSVGARLVASPHIDMVAMTGSSAVGKNIMAGCANELKRLVLELGGNDPMIVFADADLDRAAHDAVFFSFFNTGQVCCSVERVYVDAVVKEEFERKVIECAQGYSAGPGFDEQFKVGAMVSAMQRDIVAQQVDSALSLGAKLLYQGSIPSGSEYANGNWYPPTVLSNLTPDMAINQCETFGPIVALATFDGSEREAIRCANDTEYGLAAYVYTSDMVKARRVATGIRAGQVGINCYSLFHANMLCPWVGHKGSGFGYHSGEDGWRQFSLPKSLVYDTPMPTPPLTTAPSSL